MNAVYVPDVQVAKEPLSVKLFQEMLPLARKCWAESTQIKGADCAYFGEREFEIDPDFEAYERIAQRGSMVIVTLRNERELVGYVEGFVFRSMRHQKILGGYGDSMYLEPYYRAYFPVLAERFEKEMAALGAAIIGWPTHCNGALYEVLKARGYVGDDIVMEKRLCVLQ